MSKNRGGFTIVEVLIAIVMLSVGVLALSSGAGSTTRMMVNGRNKTDVYAATSSLLDSLRVIAKVASCAIPAGTVSRSDGISTVWTVTNGPAGSTSRNIRVIASYRDGRRTTSKADTLYATIHCP